MTIFLLIELYVMIKLHYIYPFFMICYLSNDEKIIHNNTDFISYLQE